LNLDQLKNITLDAQTRTKRGKEIYEVQQDAYIPGAEERSIDDLHKITRGLHLVHSKTLTNSRYPSNPMGSILYL